MDLLTSSAGGDEAKGATREKSKARVSVLIGGFLNLTGESPSPVILYCDGSYKGPALAGAPQLRAAVYTPAVRKQLMHSIIRQH